MKKVFLILLCFGTVLTPLEARGQNFFGIEKALECYPKIQGWPPLGVAKLRYKGIDYWAFFPDPEKAIGLLPDDTFIRVDSTGKCGHFSRTYPIFLPAPIEFEFAQIKAKMLPKDDIYIGADVLKTEGGGFLIEDYGEFELEKPKSKPRQKYRKGKRKKLLDRLFGGN